MKITMGLDIGGSFLGVGDKVAYCSVGYSTLLTGRIKHFTPKGITIHSGSGSIKSTINRGRNQVCLIEKAETDGLG